MNSLLSLIPLIIMFTFVPTVVASCCKFSAFVLRRRIVAWRYCFIFGFILVLLGMVVNVVTTVGGTASPPIQVLTLALIGQCTIGAWFFSRHATYANGQQLGWRGGAELAVVSLVFLGVMGFIIRIGLQYLQAYLQTLS